MALLTLKDIGKIYVSEGNVSVGIRGVNLSFDRGEFVAVTGKSGSGKSTLLNVISGMDSYEEGELYIENQATSHYLQSEWEEYREKYISFIFQDYNIIESFTVLQNVELALMHIESKEERRARALELIDRVGLTSHIKQKGSRLSGGQKQRTVIARALAKDSPIILADEPTGNLDSATSKEIIELLREVSRDKLLIVVTHNFEELKDCATRHIRIFDGAVESDHAISTSACPAVNTEDKKAPRKTKKEELKSDIKNGFTLGRTIFTSKPRLSLFLCLLMIIGTFGIFMITTLCGDAMDILDQSYMFNHIDGRVIVAKQNGEVLTEDEINALVKKHGATDYLRFDALLDQGMQHSVTIPAGNSPMDYEYVAMECTYGKSFGDDIIGRYPESSNEVFLYMPISYRDALGKDKILVNEITMSRMCLKVCGIKYYYDNNLTPQCLFTEEGFRTATAIHYLLNYSRCNITLSIIGDDGSRHSFELYNFTPSFDMEADKIFISSNAYDEFLIYDVKEGVNYTASVKFSAIYSKYDYYSGEYSKSLTFDKEFTQESFTDKEPQINTYNEYDTNYGIIISDELLRQIAEEVLNLSYKQASLFFENDKAAHSAAKALKEDGYIAVPSDTTYEPEAGEVILSIIACIMLAVVWLLVIAFLAFFINLCSARALSAFKGDMAIMRSMGIPVRVVRIGMYVRMLLALIPAFILVALGAVLIFTSPKFNEFFVYLYAWQYALIYLGMLLLTVRTTYKQIRRLFGQSVKKSLKGGNAE